MRSRFAEPATHQCAPYFALPHHSLPTPGLRDPSDDFFLATGGARSPALQPPCPYITCTADTRAMAWRALTMLLRLSAIALQIFIDYMKDEAPQATQLAS
jgi:hypothetical protein